MSTIKVIMQIWLFVGVLRLSNNVNAAFEWVHPSDRDLRTIFYQGVNASQTQVSKYTGLRGFIATTGEHVVCSSGFDVIEHPFIGKELDEVHLKKICASNRKKIKAFFKHPVLAFQQSFNSLFENQLFGITIKSAAQHQKETVGGHSVHINAMCLAQNADITEHQKRYDLCIKEYPESDLILYGVSRGAATTFNACASNQYDPQKIRLVVLEACFDSVTDAVHNSPLFLKWKALEKVFLKTMMTHTQFKQQGIAPINLVDKFPENVPVVFITSERDCIVPLASVQRVVDALKQRGKNPIYMLVLKHSSHPKYMMDNKEDTENYRDCMHALYKSLNLPYIPEYAQLGEQKGLLEKIKLF